MIYLFHISSHLLSPLLLPAFMLLLHQFPRLRSVQPLLGLLALLLFPLVLLGVGGGALHDSEHLGPEEEVLDAVCVELVPVAVYPVVVLHCLLNTVLESMNLCMCESK